MDWEISKKKKKKHHSRDVLQYQSDMLAYTMVYASCSVSSKPGSEASSPRLPLFSCARCNVLILAFRRVAWPTELMMSALDHPVHRLDLVHAVAHDRGEAFDLLIALTQRRLHSLELFTEKILLSWQALDPVAKRNKRRVLLMFFFLEAGIWAEINQCPSSAAERNIMQCTKPQTDL